MTRPIVAILLLCAGVVGTVRAEGPRGAGRSQRPTTRPGVSDAELRKLFDQLGAPRYADRESAMEALERFGPAAFDAAVAAYRRTQLFETRLRIREVVEHGFLYEAFPGGFLGIAPNAVNSSMDLRLPRGTSGIQVNMVVPNSGASRAGLRKDDVILELNGSPVPGNRPAFTEAIQAHPPETRITMRVMRSDNSVVELSATLGRRPPRHMPSDPRFHGALSRFAAFWNERVVSRPPASAPASVSPASPGAPAQPAAPRGARR